MEFQTHTISWNLTKRCNLQCAHCYLDADFRAGRKMDELELRGNSTARRSLLRAGCQVFQPLLPRLHRARTGPDGRFTRTLRKHVGPALPDPKRIRGPHAHQRQVHTAVQTRRVRGQSGFTLSENLRRRLPGGDTLLPDRPQWRGHPLPVHADRSRQSAGKIVCGNLARAYAETQNYLAEDPSCTYEPGKYGFKEIVLAAEETLGGEVRYELPWDEEARDRLRTIPTFARGMVVKGVEYFAREKQCPVVTVEVMKQARQAMVAQKGSMVPSMQEKE